MTLILCNPIDGDEEGAPTYSAGEPPPATLYWTGTEFSADRSSAREYATREEALAVHAQVAGQRPSALYRTPVAVTAPDDAPPE